ncbi:unnamed protein product [Auanema sp. JU1783]|nr:unnamed protein product [Auanema sp. JU1783]
MLQQMENTFSNNPNFEDKEPFKNRMNSMTDDLMSCHNRQKRDIKFSPIVRPENDDCKKSVFGRRMALCKMRGESPLASKSSTTVVECTETTTVYSMVKNDEFESCHSTCEYTSTTVECDSAKYHFTPRPRKAVNPFHNQLLDSIHLNTLSPSLFEPMPSPKDKENIWSIDERAILLPVDITDEDIKMTTYSPDPVFEAKLHAGLEIYWKSNAGYVPSPEGPRPIPVDSPTVIGPFENAHHSSPNGRPPVARMRTITKRNIKCQTDFTIPPSFSFDFQKILGAQCVYGEGEEANEEEFNVSTMNTSLPRKLFSEDDSFMSDNDVEEDAIDENEFNCNREGDLCDLDDESVIMHKDFCLDLSPIKKDGE